LLQDATSNYKYNFNIFNPFHIRVSPEFENCPTTVSSHLRSGPQAAYVAEGCQPVLPGPTQGFLGLTISDPHPSVIISITHWLLDHFGWFGPGSPVLVHLAKEHLLLLDVRGGCATREGSIATQNHLTIQSVGEVSIYCSNSAQIHIDPAPWWRGSRGCFFESMAARSSSHCQQFVHNYSIPGLAQGQPGANFLPVWQDPCAN